MICGFAAIFGAAAPAGAATESFSLSSAAVSGQSSVTWQGPPVNPPSTPNVFPDATSPITLIGQIDSSTGAISGASLVMPGIPQPVQQGEATTFTFSEAHPGTATGNFNSTTGAVTLNDTLTITFTGTGTLPINCVSTPINVALSGTWDSTSEDVMLAASGFTIPDFPASSGQNCSEAITPPLGTLNSSPGGVAGVVGNAFSIALHGQFAPGLPTTTSLSASPNSPQLAGTPITLTATVAPASGSGTPTGSVTFFDNGANIGSEALNGSGTATLTTSTLPSGTDQQLTAAYSGDATYSASASSPTSYTITPLPIVGVDLPASMTVPSVNTRPTVSVSDGSAPGTESALSPSAGPATGGTQVAITGTGFIPKSTVDFGSTPATGVTVNSSSSITATSPAGTGTADVTVTTPAGTSATSSADLFAYGAPTVTGVSPNVGPSGSTFANITVTGTGFVPGATVNFGSTASSTVTVNSATSITTTAPSATAGTVDVTVTTPAGTSATSATDRYTYSAAPAVAILAVPAGPAAGDTSVTITGANFTGATAVDFGSTPATNFTVSSATSIQATSPAGTSGTTVDVTVTSPSGTSATWLYDRFTYGAPTVTGISPSAGPAAGGTSVTITGTGFAPSATASDGPSVKFGTSSISASSVTVNSPTSLTVTAPAGAGAGTVDVTVTTRSGGTSTTSPADQFTYAPTVTAVSPPSGPTSGNTPVTITGSGFTGATAVNFGATAATGVTVVSPMEITATSPNGTAGAADVTVTNPSGTSPTSSADQFFYGAPKVTAIAPSAGPAGTQVTIAGTGFVGASAVEFGSAAASFTLNSASQITATAPVGSGRANVTVTTNGGTSGSAAAARFTYNSAPLVSSVTPDTGPLGGGTTVTVTGIGFTGANAVTFGSTPATSYSVTSDTTITATAPAGPGTVDVTVSTANGTSPVGPGDVFAYGPPTVTGVAPDAGVTSGGTSVVITGTGFVAGTTVKFAKVPALSTTITSPTSITAVSPAASAGSVDITVTNPAGTSATSANDVFTYSAGGAPGQASLTITNPSIGQSWSGLYATVVLSLSAGTQFTLDQPASNVTLSYRDSSGGWCPLTLTASGTGSKTSPYILTANFSGVGSSCGAPGSFSLDPGASLNVPIQLSYNSGAYLGAQTVTTTLYSGTCSSPTSCTQSGNLNGSVVGSSTVELTPPARLVSTITDSANASHLATNPVRQGFNVTVESRVEGAVVTTGQPTPTGSVEYLVDGSAVTLTSDGSTPAANPASLSSGSTAKAFYSTAGLSPGVHMLTSVYSGDSVFASSTLTESFTVLPAPTGVAFICNESLSGLENETSLGYVTAASSAPSAIPSGSSAWVNDASVSVDVDPAVITGQLTTGVTATFALSPGGSTSTTTVTGAGSATDNVFTWSSMSAAVPVTGDPGSTVLIGVGSIDYVYNSGLGTTTFTCTPISADAPMTSVTVAGTTLTASPSGSAAPGASITLSAAVAPAPPVDGSQAGLYGQVVFYDGSSVLGTVPVDAVGDATNGTATYTTNQLALGDHQLTAVWSGGGGVPANTSNVLDYQVGSSSTTTLASSSNPANAADPVTFTATVNGVQGSSAPTGDVNFVEDGSPITSCQNVGLSTATPPTATCKVTLGAGETHSIVATYSGDATYIGSTSAPVSQVTLPGTKTTILSTKDPSPPGNVTFWAGVSPASGTGATPTGTVAFSIDGSTYKACASRPLGAGGGASCTASFKAGTSHKVFATYAGSSSYSGSKSSTITQTMTGSSSSTKPKATGGSATLASGKALTSGQSLTAASYRLTMQGDGNLVEYQGTKALWSTHTAGHEGAGVVMQKDGNLVEYFHGKAIWSTKTAGHAGAHLTLQGSDGNVVIYTPANKPLWATGT